MSPDPRQRSRWWMYRSSTQSAAQPDPARVASRAEHVADAVIAVPAPVNAASWDRLNPSVLGPNDDSDEDSSDEEVEEVVVLSEDEPEVQEMEMVGQAVVTVEGDR